MRDSPVRATEKWGLDLAKGGPVDSSKRNCGDKNSSERARKGNGRWEYKHMLQGVCFEDKQKSSVKPS